MIEQFFRVNLVKILAGCCTVLFVALVVMINVNAHHVNQRDAARTAKKEQVAEYRRVYNETYSRHFAAAQAENSRLEKIKDEANANTEPRRTAAMDSAARYRDAHRCRVQPGAPNFGAAGEANLSGAAADPRRPQEPASGPLMVAITDADHDACTVNTTDLGIAYEWAQKLVDQPRPDP